MAGDELKLRYAGELRKPWEGVGQVINTPTGMACCARARFVFFIALLSMLPL